MRHRFLEAGRENPLCRSHPAPGVDLHRSCTLSYRDINYFSPELMRLINTNTLALEEFFSHDVPPYAILSHTWGSEEVTFEDWKNLANAREKKGFQKIELARVQAIRQGYEYLWVDTNCINKDSSAELSEAINSMFAWYRDAEVCYAFLSDVSEDKDGPETITKDELFLKISQSQWFTRGWTLQELLAPRQVLFFSREWRQVGTRKSLALLIARTTNIGSTYLYHKKKKVRESISAASIAERMSWLSRRRTTRVEDMAYCMLGIFDINMPLLYGEGGRAFTRLQEEILRVSADESLFCWSWNEDDPAGWSSMLAPSPRNFRNAREYQPSRDETSRPRPYSMTNFGLSIQLPIIRIAQMPHSAVHSWLRPFEYIGLLSASTADDYLVGVPLEKTKSADTYKVVRDFPRPITLQWKSFQALEVIGINERLHHIFVPSREPGWNPHDAHVKSFDQRFSLGEYAALLLVINGTGRSSSVTDIEAIPRYNKSKAGFLKLKRFTIAGPPGPASTSSPEHFHATEAHGAVARISCDWFNSKDEPLWLVIGVLVSEQKATKWFCTVPGGPPKDDSNSRHRYLEMLLVDAAADWESLSRRSAGSGNDTESEERVNERNDVTTTLGPEFRVEANYQNTTARALHLVIGGHKRRTTCTGPVPVYGSPSPSEQEEQ